MVSLLLIVVVIQGAPARPALPRGADPNDWQAYFDRGADILKRYPNRADSMFDWASRLDPSRAEPLAARWVAFWMRDINRFERYLTEEVTGLDSAAVRKADTLFLRALQRNPFVPRTLLLLPFEQLPGDWQDNSLTLGWLAYSRQQYALAASHFRQIIQRDPVKNVWIRFNRALTFVPRQAFDSATIEMTALLATLRAREDTESSPVYESKELTAYGIGLLHLVQGHADSARRFFQDAVVENLAFFPAYAELGDLALARGDKAIAAREYGHAAELAADDPWIQHRYGVALLRMGRAVDAIAPLERAISLDPWYAEPYLMLGIAWDAAGDKDAAAKALEQYVARAPRRDSDAVDDAKRRLAALQARGP